MFDNVFFNFCKKYWDEIVDFADALYAWIKAIALGDDAAAAE